MTPNTHLEAGQSNMVVPSILFSVIAGFIMFLAKGKQQINQFKSKVA
jgi:hypothetical protein